MRKTYETKSKIIRLLRDGHMTPTQLRAVLQLSASTVSQHLHELYDQGVVVYRHDEHLRKLKYFSLSAEYSNLLQTEEKLSSKIFNRSIAARLQ